MRFAQTLNEAAALLGGSFILSQIDRSNVLSNSWSRWFSRPLSKSRYFAIFIKEPHFM